MGAFLTFLADHRAGILLVLVMLGTVGILIHWMTWLFKLGRYKPDKSETKHGTRTAFQPLAYVFANFFVEIVNDFRHFLALSMVLLFGLIIFVAMWIGLRNGEIEDMTKGLQTVAAAMGGLIGSIIGYYFGESAATKRQQPAVAAAVPAKPPVQKPDKGADETADVRPAAKPAGLTDGPIYAQGPQPEPDE